MHRVETFQHWRVSVTTTVITRDIVELASLTVQAGIVPYYVATSCNTIQWRLGVGHFNGVFARSVLKYVLILVASYNLEHLKPKLKFGAKFKFPIAS